MRLREAKSAKQGAQCRYRGQFLSLTPKKGNKLDSASGLLPVALPSPEKDACCHALLSLSFYKG